MRLVVGILNSGLAVIGYLLMCGLSANATLLGPGGTVEPQNFSGPLPAGSFIASETTSISGAGWTANLISAVYQESGGTLDFLYQIINSATSTDFLTRLTVTSFEGFTTDVGYSNNAVGPFSATTPGKHDPVSVDSSPTGSTIGFTFYVAPIGPPINFPGAGAKLNPGDTSAVEIVKTNALSYMQGRGGLSDGAANNGPVFAPAAEPTSIMLLGSSLFGLTTLLRKRLGRRA